MQQTTTSNPTTESESSIIIRSILEQAQKLSPLEKAELISEIAASMKESLASPPMERPPQFIGIWANENITDADIAEARREMWGNFPREDI